MKSPSKSNRLINEKSPYLLQHAHNPVDWYPWGEVAFEKAKSQDRPIFLSIGYSTCHWCHVMEKESFEDEKVARLLNENFVCIKVDREERPDIDNIYMTVCQMLTGSGGWPLTIIMTSDKKPFFAATYIPKESRFGMAGLLDLIPKISQIWANQRGEILNSAEQVITTLKWYPQTSKGEELDASILDSAYGDLLNSFDENYGGFGSAPKFPSPHNLIFLLWYWKRADHQKALHMVEDTLKKMRQGGIWDHVGFGFHRYSTDRFWLVPHFEKMLYDQAMLALAYTEAFYATGKSEYKETVEELLQYVLRDMTSSEGGFYSAEDADSEGEEGKFYLWTEEEIRGNLGDETENFKKVFNISKDGNYIDEIKGKKTKKNILHLKKSYSDLAKDMDVPLEELKINIEKARQIFYANREKRVHPHKDDKILTDWNGLMIAAFAKAGFVFGNADYIGVAKNAADFILTNMDDKDNGLLHRFREGEAAIPGFLDDYAFFVWGLIELYESTFELKYLSHAIEYTKYSIEHFWDEEGGGFFLTSDHAENLLVRHKTGYDGAIPSGNSIAMLNLIRLARISGNSGMEEKAQNVKLAFSSDINNHPLSHTQFLTAYDFLVGPSFEVVIVGDLDSEDTKDIMNLFREYYFPNMVLLHKPIDRSTNIESISPFTKDMSTINGKTTVYVCRNFSCELPTNDKEKILKLLNVKNIL
ncbi:MAG: thioredoxin domain-containing protein [Thermoplasmata archaeon]|nr:MAG: thioredoxin domain-containing protein [Thermoplasmata archaeon]